MSNDQEREYFRRREAQERTASVDPKTPAGRVHAELAQQYAKLATGTETSMPYILNEQ